MVQKSTGLTENFLKLNNLMVLGNFSRRFKQESKRSNTKGLIRGKRTELYYGHVMYSQTQTHLKQIN